MRVRAIARGYHGGQLKNPGDLFEVEEGQKSAWFVPEGEQDLAPKTSGQSTGRKPRPQQSATEDSGSQ